MGCYPKLWRFMARDGWVNRQDLPLRFICMPMLMRSFSWTSALQFRGRLDSEIVQGTAPLQHKMSSKVIGGGPLQTTLAASR
eukprot:6270414-Amphidinium_carterae.1